jgi:hypothetical protein
MEFLISQHFNSKYPRRIYPVNLNLLFKSRMVMDPVFQNLKHRKSISFKLILKDTVSFLICSDWDLIL